MLLSVVAMRPRVIRRGSGILAAGAADVTGVGVSQWVGSGALAAQAATVDGTGFVFSGVGGFGVLEADAATVAGSGVSLSTGSGSLEADVATIEGIDEMPWQLAGTPSTGGGGTGVWDHSGDVANVDFTGLAGLTEVKVLIRDVTLSASGQRALRLSTDNGSTFLLASGDYKNIAEDGQSTDDSFMAFHLTASTAARSGEIIVRGINLTAPKTSHRVNRNTNTLVVIPTTSAVNAVRIFGSAGGNLTAGSIRVYGR